MRPVSLDTDTLKKYYAKLKRHEIAFNDHVPNTPEGFASIFLNVNEDFSVSANGLVWEVDDVGILYLTHIAPKFSALAHFAFWDRRFRGREDLIRQMLDYCFEKFGFHRIEVRIALYANGMMSAVERIGFTKEGRLRQAVLKNNEWYDVNLYSILESEVRNGAEASHHAG